MGGVCSQISGVLQLKLQCSIFCHHFDSSENWRSTRSSFILEIGFIKLFSKEVRLSSFNFLGVFPLSISNSFYGSKLIINEHMLVEIQQFKERYIWHNFFWHNQSHILICTFCVHKYDIDDRFVGVSLDSIPQYSQGLIPSSSISPMGLCTFSPRSSQWSGWTQFTEQEMFMYKAPYKTLAEIQY